MEGRGLPRVPGGQFYKKMATTSKDKVCFVSEGEATKAGYRPSKRQAGAAGEEMVVKHRRQGLRLGILVLLVIAGGIACQAGPPLQGSILDECARPTLANREWCLSMQHPNTK